jgi:hypothetical protein
MNGWPTAQLDAISRLRVLAEGVPSGALVEREFAVPFDRLWTFVGDLERSVPVFDDTVTGIEVRRRALVDDGAERLDVVATTRPGDVRVRFDVRLEPGFCWMVQPQRLYVVGMAATPIDATRTRYAHVEGIPRRGSRLGRRFFTRHVRHDVDGIARALELP